MYLLRKAINQTEEPIRLAKLLLEELQRYTESGLPSEYSDASEYLFDFYPQLPWDEEGLIEALEFLTTNEEAVRIIQDFSDSVKFDMLNELEDAYQEEMGYI